MYPLLTAFADVCAMQNLAYSKLSFVYWPEVFLQENYFTFDFELLYFFTSKVYLVEWV